MRHPDDQCGELLGAYVLGACPEPEADGVAEHLARCATCAADAERLREGADILMEAGAPTPPTPPTDVKGRVMAQVRAEAALFEAARQGGYQPRGSAAQPTRSRWSLPRVRLWAPGPAVAVASVLILAALGAGLLSGGLGSGAPGRDVVAAQIKGGHASAAAGSLELRGDRAHLRVRGLRSPGRGRVYQVWVRKDRQVPEPAGAVLAVDSRGAARARLSGNIRRFDQVLVTSEPAGGSRLPTRVPVLEVDTTA